MATISFRPDYAKFLIDCEPDLWQSIYRGITMLSHERKYKAEWLKSHKVNRLWYNAAQGMETWSLEIWGEWSGLVELFDPSWLERIKRFDVRANVWDATKDTILDIGQHLQRNVTSHNINVYNTRPASKRLGRDRGGVGFAIGSHKSDLRITCYKRTGEPVAQEFQCSGAMLNRLVEKTKRLIGPNAETRSVWLNLKHQVEHEGNARLARVLESAGIGTYWPIIGSEGLPNLPAIQGGFIADVSDVLGADDALLGPTME